MVEVTATPDPREKTLARTAREVRELAHDIARLWDQLGLFLEAGSAAPDPNARRAARSEAPAPANLDALVARDDRTAHDGGHVPVRAVVRRAAEAVAAARSLTVPAGVHRQAHMLAVHADWIADAGWAPRLLPLLHDCRRALQRACGEHGHPPLAACPSIVQTPDGPRACTGQLWPTTGTLGVRCDGECHSRWTGPEALNTLRLLLAG